MLWTDGFRGTYRPIFGKQSMPDSASQKEAQKVIGPGGTSRPLTGLAVRADAVKVVLSMRIFSIFRSCSMEG